MDKDLIDQTRKMVEDIRVLLQNINEYLWALRRQTEKEIADIESRQAARDTAPDPRQPYLAGRQPRRDGDSYGSVQPVAAGGSLDHDPAGAVRPTGKR